MLHAISGQNIADAAARASFSAAASTSASAFSTVIFQVAKTLLTIPVHQYKSN
jgi:hypothetical protein